MLPCCSRCEAITVISTMQPNKASISFDVTPPKWTIQDNYCCDATQGAKAFTAIWITVPKELRQVQPKLLNMLVALNWEQDGSRFCCYALQGTKVSIPNVDLFNFFIIT
jgi:hypothetical protein